LQTLVNAARERNEPGIFVAFEETTRQIPADAAGFDWDALAKSKLFSLRRPCLARVRERLCRNTEVIARTATISRRGPAPSATSVWTHHPQRRVTIKRFGHRAE
jgi:KaiC/GvpD/RAD55 family RecA-like ATPase